MNTSKMSAFGVIAVEELLMDCDFGRDLAATKTGEKREYRGKCRECIDRFVFLILDNVTVTSGISCGLYSFRPEIMLEGDDQHVFELFSSLCELFATCNVLSSDELKAASAEYKSYDVERQRHPENATYAASEIHDVVQFLLRDFGFQSRLVRLYCGCSSSVALLLGQLIAILLR